MGVSVPHAVRPLEDRITLPAVLLVDLIAAVVVGFNENCARRVRESGWIVYGHRRKGCIDVFNVSSLVILGPELRLCSAYCLAS